MKIYFDTFAEKEIEIIEYLSDNIVKFKFRNFAEDSKKEFWKEYEKSMNHVLEVNKKSLEKEMIYKGYNKFGSRDDLMKINLNHCLNSDYYFTNGQKVISVLRKDDSYELGVHNYVHFKGYFPPLNNFFRFSLESFKLKKLNIEEHVESIVSGILSNLTIKRIQVEKDFIEILQLFSSIYHIKYKDETYRIDISYPNNNLDFQFENFLNQLKLNHAKCCINCVSFEPMTAGHLKESKLNGYCKKMIMKLPEQKYPTTNMFNWCQRFDKL